MVILAEARCDPGPLRAHPNLTGKERRNQTSPSQALHNQKLSRQIFRERLSPLIEPASMPITSPGEPLSHSGIRPLTCSLPAAISADRHVSLFVTMLFKSVS
jgi:hypothetical protein